MSWTFFVPCWLGWTLVVCGAAVLGDTNCSKSPLMAGAILIVLGSLALGLWVAMGIWKPIARTPQPRHKEDQDELSQ